MPVWAQQALVKLGMLVTGNVTVYPDGNVKTCTIDRVAHVARARTGD